jgi:hypothetical protein
MNKIRTINGVSPLCDKNNADLFLLGKGFPLSGDWSPILDQKNKCNPLNAYLFLNKLGFGSKIDVEKSYRSVLRSK